MNRLILLIFPMILAGSIGPAYAGRAWHNRVWSTDSFLDNRILSIKQSCDGFLWVATPRELTSFDGFEFRPSPLTKELTYKRKLSGVFFDSRDRMWIGIHTGDILCLDHDSIVLQIPDDAPPNNPGYLSFAEDNEGVIYLCFQKGRSFRVLDGRVEPLKEDGLAASSNRQVVKDGLGRIWFSNGTNGLGLIKDGRLLSQETLSVNNITGSRSGGVWICSGKELWKCSAPGSLEKVCNLPEDLLQISQNAFLEDSRGCVWIGAQSSGVFRFDGNSLLKMPSPSGQIDSMFEDMAGNIWLGTTNGLNQLYSAAASFIPSGSGSKGRDVIGICADKSNFVWIIWNSLQISKSMKGDPLESATLADWSVVDSRAVPQAQCTVADPAGDVWFGTDSSGLYLWKNEAVAANISTHNGLAGADVTALHMTEGGVLWIGSRSKHTSDVFLQSWRSGVLQTYNLPSNSVMITAITTDSRSNCWFFCRGGYLFRVDGSGMLVEETKHLPPGWNRSTSLCCTPDGSLWFGSAVQGLGRLKNGRFRSYTTEHGLNEYSTRICFDGTSRLWFSGMKSIFSVRFDDFDDIDAGRSMLVQSVVYGRKEGITSSRPSGFFWPSSALDSTGRLLLGLQGGVAVIHPPEPVDIKPPPPVIIDSVKLDGRAIAVYGSQDSITPDATQPGPVELRQSGKVRLHIPPGSSHLEISFTALSFKLPESTVFRYRLKGDKDEWKDIGHQRTVSYYDMRPGDYDFQVIARNSDGVWNKTGASLALTIEPFWWETVWFSVGGPLAVFGVLLGSVIIFLRHRQKLQIERLQLMQVTEKERARIAADLHDEMGSGLTEIGMTGDLVLSSGNLDEQPRQYVGEIVDKARSLTESLDEIVWAANPKHDSIASLVGYFVYYIQHVLEKASIRVRLDIPDVLPKAVINPSVRHHLFLAFREAVTNVVKHAGASEVSLAVAVEDGMLDITIHDDGRGIGERPEGSQGDGLSNMSHRLEQIGGKCSVSGEPGKGTTVKFEVELTGSFYDDSAAG